MRRNGDTGSDPDSMISRRAGRLKPSAVREILKATEDPQVISFAGGLPAAELFPTAALAEVSGRVLRQDGAAALQYGPTEGYRPLRAWVAGHLSETGVCPCTAEQVLITAGSQQALDLVARVLLDRGGLVVSEQPAYLGALQAFAAAEAEFVPVPGDGQGMCVDELERSFARLPAHPRLIYVNPTFQNPRGSTMPLDRRRRLLEIATDAGIPVLEDDPYGSLRYGGERVPSLAALANEAGVGGNVIYLGTSSKILAPGLRVAWLVTADPALFERLVTLKQATDLHTSSFTQRLVHGYVAQEGVLARHVRSLVETYRRRRDAMLGALEAHLLDGASWTVPDGGLFLWVRLPGGVNTTELLHQALRAGVAFVPSESFYFDAPDRQAMRLNFSHAVEERIEEGVRRLARLIRQALE